ncbi:23S rRNA (adenine(2030)-N(6))-methyltransferase RlmJ [Pseudoalteromonas rubra]|uniref:Ribosomal RNA large subunit methyltransferase J n=1 Tax=Pseudoalteromonas rubra TaxID=43658 RepID=A0A5S3V3E9_9GAMM|nr:23S rRNA (adenine(2030)-N(6))-methyltransferase RlmJ [Pseudoalteromonas rubra]MEC4088434.1 23S rRNA (adenine(2030)-N(6))-methyltransferase RlmJ [Pseudoalteromonas rubra]QPB81954.1 23S rRNA (adenine(2030)-N(6))-methyltransferase RlmJ [Pseudoalteromonas rubra]
MLSYRHSFHAGNPADVIKHLVLAQVLEYMTRKDKPFDYIDTHSGAGLFELAAKDAQKTQEYLQGIAKLWSYAGQVDAIRGYVDVVKSLNKDTLAYYPGSPKVAEQFLRKQDKGWFFELHPQDLKLLEKNTGHKRSLRVKGEDGFKGLMGLVPPQSRRACVLMDPPYEIKSDYEVAARSIIKAHKRFSSGTYMIWYPVVERARIDQMEQTLIGSGVRNIQLFELATEADTEERGMTASGMIVINPPWTLKATMDEVLPELVQHLSSETGFFRSEQLVAE